MYQHRVRKLREALVLEHHQIFVHREQRYVLPPLSQSPRKLLLECLVKACVALNPADHLVLLAVEL